MKRVVERWVEEGGYLHMPLPTHGGHTTRRYIAHPLLPGWTSASWSVLSMSAGLHADISAVVIARVALFGNIPWVRASVHLMVLLPVIIRRTTMRRLLRSSSNERMNDRM